jgi:hypothetical protein
MISEHRLYFEAELLKSLKSIASNFEGVVASKNKLKFKYKKKYVAEIFLDHLARVDSYVLCGMVYGGEIYECTLGFTPPYRSNLFNDGCLSFISSGEGTKRFSGDLGGAITTPSPPAAAEICIHIRAVLEDFYIPKILSCITPTERTVNDVITAPEQYAYPAVFIHCAVRIGGLYTARHEIEKALMSKKIVKDKSYDTSLLLDIL